MALTRPVIFHVEGIPTLSQWEKARDEGCVLLAQQRSNRSNTFVPMARLIMALKSSAPSVGVFAVPGIERCGAGGGMGLGALLLSLPDCVLGFVVCRYSVVCFELLNPILGTAGYSKA